MGGVAEAWPGVEMRRCEYHLGRNLMEVLPQRVRETQADELRQAALRAQHSVANWDAYLALLNARAAVEPGFTAAVHRSTLLESVIRTQAATRSPGRTALHRASRDLLPQPRADHRGRLEDDEQGPRRRAPAAAHREAQRLGRRGRLTQLIRDHLAARKGHATQQRLRTDPITAPSLR